MRKFDEMAEFRCFRQEDFRESSRVAIADARVPDGSKVDESKGNRLEGVNTAFGTDSFIEMKVISYLTDMEGDREWAFRDLKEITGSGQTAESGMIDTSETGHCGWVMEIDGWAHERGFEYGKNGGLDETKRLL